MTTSISTGTDGIILMCKEIQCSHVANLNIKSLTHKKNAWDIRHFFMVQFSFYFRVEMKTAVFFENNNWPYSGCSKESLVIP